MNSFHHAHVYSLTEHLIKIWPEDFMGGAGFIKSLMSVAVWELFFPNLKQYDKDNQVDFRCGFNKQFLKEGGLKDSEVSKVTFKDDNVIELDLHFGCAVYLFDKKGPLSDFNMSNLLSLLESMTIDIHDPRWTTSRSFYMSTKATINAEFG